MMIGSRNKQFLLLTSCLLSWASSRAFLVPFGQRHEPRLSSTQGALFASASPTSTTQGTSIGHSEVDMNRYNLDPDAIPEEWAANMQVANSMQAAGVYLGAKDKTKNFVDTLKVVVPCPPPGEGLGIELLELAGGRGDGLGITMVSGLVEGKPAENSGLIYGDSIVALSLRERSSSEGDMEELFTTPVECLDYDGTIDGILSMVGKANEVQESEPNSDLFYVLTIKRLRRKPKISMLLQYPPSQGEPDVQLELFAGENLRRAMLARGVKLNDPFARRFDSGGAGDCGAEATCATCAVNVVQGLELFNDKGQQEEKILEKYPRWRFACRAIVGYGMQEGDMVVRVSPRQWEE